MPKLFGVDIAAIIDSAMSGGLLDATLHSVTPGTRTPGDPTSGTQPTEVARSCKGMVDDYTDGQIDGMLVQVGDRIVLLIGNSIDGLAVPEPGDGVTIEGVRYFVVRVKRDPAAATYVCQARKV